MNRHNAAMNRYAVTQLRVQTSDRVLEIGFGGGVTLSLLVGSATFVDGLDASAEMVKWAKTKYATDVRGGRAAFREGRVEALPYSPGSFEKVCTVNSVYFWPSLSEGIDEIYRVLAPGGRVAVGLLPKEFMDTMDFPKDIFVARSSDEVVAALLGAGFTEVTPSRPTAETKWMVIVATR
jgi:ubiquinone/menaquinone biosynthesis C-methylase UbiE